MTVLLQSPLAMTPPRKIAELAAYLPPDCGFVLDVVRRRLACDVIVTRPRRSKLGDHRAPGRDRPRHRITINEDLNPYAFLTTLLHEVAHATTWERHRSRRFWLRPHGPEWQEEYAALMTPIVEAGVLPVDVAAALARSMQAPRASSCGDRELALALANYDRPRPHRVRVEDLEMGTVFRVDEGGLVLRADRSLRTRRVCFDVTTGEEYRVHGLAFVEPLPRPPHSRPRGTVRGTSGATVSGSRSRSRRSAGRTHS